MTRLPLVVLLALLAAPAAFAAPSGPGEVPLPGRTEGQEEEPAAERVPAQDRSAAEAPAEEPADGPDGDDEAAETFGATVTVTAERRERPAAEAIAPTTVLDLNDLARAPAPVLDETLRRVPAFSLFRRSSSVTAHPTTQGVTLRGIAPSGTSRSLVLFDGVPWNDPFGGWVVWNRVPALALERVEVVPGAGSALYGSAALSGVIQLLPREPRKGTLEAVVRVGERGTRGAEGFAAGSNGAPTGWGWTAAARGFETDGYHVVAPEDRGPVDVPAGVELGSLWGRLARRTEGGRFHVGVNGYAEQRGNGTRLQTNSTRIAAAETGWEGRRWRLRLAWQEQELESDFSRILPGRTGEVPTAETRFPSTGWSGSAVRASAGGTLVGIDWRRATWHRAAEPDEAQDLAGAWVQRSWDATDRLRLLGGVRVDLWENTGTETSVNPRVGAVYTPRPDLALRASAYRGFRAPTLNELHRPFRVGNVITRENPDLGEERLLGVEAGFDWTPTGHRAANRWHLRADLFWNELDDPVGNATVEVTPELVFRQRRNLGLVSVLGVEAEAAWGRGPWSLRAAALALDAEVEETGLEPPQTPSWRATLEAARAGRVDAVLVARWTGDQFEDDLNRLELGQAMVVDLRLSTRLSGKSRAGGTAEVFLAVENLFGRRLPTGLVPVERVAAPRLVSAGIAWR